MITINTDGNPISTEFVDVIRSDSPRTLARLWYNGAELDCAIENITVEKGSCGSNPFMIGEVVGDLLTATVRGLFDDIKGQVIECHIGAYTGDSYEFISLGKFKVSTVKKTRYESQITAYSPIVADSGNDFDASNLTSPTLAEVAIRLQSDLNCTITFDQEIDTTVTLGALLTDLTDYQVLQMLAICCGGYAVNTIDGNIAIKRYNATPTLDVDTGMMVDLPVIAEKEYRVRQIGVLVSDATEDADGNPIDAVYYTLDSQAYLIALKQGTEYYIVDEQGNRIIANIRPYTADIYFECPYMTEEIFTANIANLVGYAYYPADINLTLGDPRLEGMDVLAVTEVNGNVYTVPCHKLTHTYNGGFTTAVKSANASDEEDSIGTEYPVTRRLQSMSRQTGKAQETANQAYRIAGTTNQYFWFRGTGDDTGAHITEIPQEQWDDPDSPYYQSGGNLLARSNGIAVREGLKELAVMSKDGFDAKTYDANDNEVIIAHLGYGPGTSSSGGTADAPYYTLGIRDSNNAVGNYSVAEGDGTVASGFASHAEGYQSQAKAHYSHAEGYQTIADLEPLNIGFATHQGIHAGGNESIAYGNTAFAHGKNAIAHTLQTVIGISNIETTDNGDTILYEGITLPQHAFVIGNGSLDGYTRSNAFAVDWDGNVTISNHASPIGTVKYESLPSNKSVPNNTGTELVRIDLDKGVWVIVAGVRWAENTNGYRQLNVYGVSGSTEIQLLTAPANGHYTQMNFSRILEVSADNTPIFLNGRQTSGSALNALAGGGNWGTYITAVRII